MEQQELQDRLVALSAVVSALIDAHPDPAKLAIELSRVVSAIEAHPLHRAAQRELDQAVAQVSRRLKTA